MAIVAICTIAYILSVEELNAYTLQNLLMGITTGAIISVVIALIGYFHEREDLISRATDISMSTYLDLMVLQELIAYALNSIGHTTRMQDIPFGYIASIARKTFENYSDVSGKLYVPFFKSGNVARKYSDFTSYRPIFQNMALIAQSIESIALQIDIEYMKTTLPTSTACQTASSSPLLPERNMLLLVRVSKFHEHVTDRTMQYETIAQYFVNRASGKEAWKHARQKIDAEVAEIISNYTMKGSAIP